jgi:hypothetical protein
VVVEHSVVPEELVEGSKATQQVLLLTSGTKNVLFARCSLVVGCCWHL